MSTTSQSFSVPLAYSAQRPAIERALEARGGTVLHWLAVLTTAATFPLIFMGGLVTSHHAGMSVPDWPNTFGYNMFLFPPNKWVGGILYEHTHRLMATAVGFGAVVLALFAWGIAESAPARRRLLNATAWTAAATLLAAAATKIVASNSGMPGNRTRLAHVIAMQAAVVLGGLTLVLAAASFARQREPRRWVRWLALSVLGVVIFQGVLGGLRVVLVKLDLAIIHACIAQAFFCLIALLAIVTSGWWREPPALAATGTAINGLDPNGASSTGLSKRSASNGRMASGSPLVLGALTVCAVYMQLVVGATMRHYDAGLAIPDFPLAYGKILPPTSENALALVNHVRGFELNLDPVSMTQVWLHFGHRVGALAVSVLALALAWRCIRIGGGLGLRPLAAALVLWLATQITLGAFVVLRRKPADIASLHVGIGALVLLTSFVLTVRGARLRYLMLNPER